MKRKYYLIIKSLLVVFLLATITPHINAQKIFGSSRVWTGKESKEETWRKKIDIDMSVSDFKTSKIDPNVMGWRLAKLLHNIQESYQQGTNNRILSFIQYELTEDPRVRYANIDKWDFVSAEKKDSVILIKWHALTKLEKKEKVEHDIYFKIVNGITESERINEYLSNIGRYIKPDEDENE